MGEISEEKANEIVQTCYKREQARKVAESALKIAESRSDASLSELQGLLSDVTEEYKGRIEVSDDIEETIKGTEEDTRWKFNIATLRQQLEGLGPGTFLELAARPETGKTAAWVSFCAAPGGWLWQGAKVLALCNEEQAHKVRMRAMSSCTGMTKQQILNDTNEAKRLYEPIKGTMRLFDVVGIELSEVDRMVAQYEPDIVVVDQLDKVRIPDSTRMPSHERLGDLYVGTREIAKRRNVLMVGISQLSADAQDKTRVDYSMLAGSKTGKAAEADVIMAIGMNTALFGELSRTINLSKNKISGSHASINCMLRADISRYVE